MFETRRKDRRHAIMCSIQVLANRMSLEYDCMADITVRQLSKWSGIGLRRTHRSIVDLVKEGYISLVTIENNNYHKIVKIKLNPSLLLAIGIQQKHIHQTKSFKLKSLEMQGKTPYQAESIQEAPKPIQKPLSAPVAPIDTPEREMSGPERIRMKIEMAVKEAARQKIPTTTMAEAKSFIASLAKQGKNRNESNARKLFSTD